MFRAKSVDLVGNSSVGFGPSVWKFGQDVGDEVTDEKKSATNCQSMFRIRSVDLVGNSSVGFG
jgi:hypothetical protein